MTRRPCYLPLRSFSILLALLAWMVLAARPAAAQDAAQEILAAVNQARADAGLSLLGLNPLLSQAAQGHVDDMLTNYIYGHYGSDGSSVRTRVARTGYSAQPWVSENWVSAASPAGAMRWWMNDYIHRVNILTPNWSEIGIGVGNRGSEMIFVTVFAAGGGASAASVAAMVDEPAEPPSVRIEPQTVPAGGLDYTVQPGDTLLAIGLRYGLAWETIAEANGLTERSLLQIGQVVHVPGPDGPAAIPAAPALETELYQVAPGDTLFGIAARRGLTWQEVAAVNGFGEDTVLQIAQVIFVPKTEAVAEPVAAAAPDWVPGVTAPEIDGAPVATAAIAELVEPAPATTGIGGPVPEAADWYTVAPGDTVISIAVRHGVDWETLLALNGLEEDTLLQLGQRLRLR